MPAGAASKLAGTARPTFSPETPASARESLERISTHIVPSLGELKAPYSEEAVRAGVRRQKLVELKADLDSVPLVGGGTLVSWAESFVAAGEEIGVLLSHRVDAEKGTERVSAPGFRGEVIGLLNRFRAALRDEVNFNTALPRNLEDQIFGRVRLFWIFLLLAFCLISPALTESF